LTKYLGVHFAMIGAKRKNTNIKKANKKKKKKKEGSHEIFSIERDPESRVGRG
jgi:hypothetical protein